ncbi:4'-phosphopantetheinyl transferase family protein [Paenibacillus sp. NPDC058071]|uniref:4'-phosphopantetheinyl transferase family protein n=1 Tax=Paenibacillus sp. NPDC058071 TaxID=3346326 RepID=UPI0036DAD394
MKTHPIVFAVKVPQTIESHQWESGLNRISAERRQRITRFRLQADKHRSLLAEVLVRQVLQRTYGLSDSQIGFRIGPYGKPYLAEGGPFFNFSHSGEWVAAVFHDREVGIDIEQVRTVDMDLAERFFTPEESSMLAGLKEEERPQQFFRLWTMKEA